MSTKERQQLAAKEAALAAFKREALSIEKIYRDVKDQLNRLKVEELDIMNRQREQEVRNALNSASVNWATSHSATLTEFPSGTELQADQVNKTHLDLSMAPTLAPMNNSTHGDSSDDDHLF
ncbi:uncharacterized protein LOC130689372 [Daphnia carinata]|uniref:uncharacterized protein LOC130689372 n=1 Tax=Daphnia carinata TaxID=120202 RepID=UPI00257EF349|nr:uncharacterized protein LOC130689372 [Daphnia carinata]XP_057368327.1 uncharacterized protein LOC130689372 [Daphnia carinata]